jgi:glycosyltransferase involved in cell wall biosynthesis
MPALYSGAEIFIYPSLLEGFGIPILEAVTCKTPVITTQGGCFEESGGPGSVYIDPADAEQLAEEINTLLSSPEKRRSMSVTGFEHSKKFRPEVISSQMIKLYKEDL